MKRPITYRELSQFEKLSDLKPLLRDYLKDSLNQWHTLSSNKQSEAAYMIAGLLSLEPIRHAPDNDPYVKILLLAGQLELPKSLQKKGSSWRLFTEMIKKL